MMKIQLLALFSSILLEWSRAVPAPMGKRLFLDLLAALRDLGECLITKTKVQRFVFIREAMFLFTLYVGGDFVKCI